MMGEAARDMEMLGLPQEAIDRSLESGKLDSAMEDGRLINYLVVSPYKGDWLLDRECIEKGRVPAYVYNYDAPANSESGTISIMHLSGRMFRRTW